MTVRLALSPCPNDTFTFHAWLHGLIDGAPSVDTQFADIQHLNEWATQGTYDLIKVSFGVLPKILDTYRLLPCGAALGRNCGPKIVSLKPYTLADLPKLKVAVPGMDTSAKLLMDLLCPTPLECVSVRYDQIPTLLQEGKVDAGLIIHETRFLLDQLGLQEITDVGELWEAKYQSPVPLGCIVAHRQLSTDLTSACCTAIQQSLTMAWDTPEASSAFVREHAQHQDPAVTRAHIDLYVNDESLQLSSDAMKGIQALLDLSAETRGTFTAFEDWIFEPSTHICHGA